MKIKIIWIIFSMSFLFFANNNFAENTKPLPGDQAFNFSIKQGNQANIIIADWKIAPGYYLYRERFSIETTPTTAFKIQYPKTIMREDTRGKYAAYAGHLSIPLIFTDKKLQNLQIDIQYQGCSQGGFCYSPVHKKINIDSNGAISLQTITAEKSTLHSLLNDQNSVQHLLKLHSFSFGVLFLFAGLGLLLAFTPCVLPMIPILTTIIVGQQKVTTRKALLLSLTYILGMALTYAIAGVLAAYMGSSLQILLQKPWVIGVTAALFTLLALSLFGAYELQLPRRLHNRLSSLHSRQTGGTHAGVFAMGVLSTLIVSPCITAPLAGVLLYIGQTGDQLLGGAALFAMGLGMGLPLLLIGISAGKYLPKRGPWMIAIKQLFGFLMIGMAIWLLSRILSDLIIATLCGLFLLGLAYFFVAQLPKLIGKRRLNHILGYAVGLSGMMIMFGGLDTNYLPGVHRASTDFTVVRNVADFDKILLAAKTSHRPIILDFYADWCESCVSMDTNVFKQQGVQKELKNYILLRADLSDNTAADEELLKRFSVIAPPTVIFFDANGKERNTDRIIGEVNANEFLARLNDYKI